MTKIAIIVDAACDLPAAFIAENKLFVLPFNVLTADKSVLDNGTPQSKEALYQSHIRNKSSDFATTAVIPTYEIESYFYQHIVFKFDAAIFISVSASRSLMFEQMQQAWTGMAVSVFGQRQKQGLSGKFDCHIVDSKNMGPGQGLLAYAAVAALKVSQDVQQVLQFVERTRDTLFTYGVADDLLYVYTRAKQKNENSITWGKYTLANVLNLKPILRFHAGQSSTVGRGRGFEGALEQVVSHVQAKLVASDVRIALINVSFAGDLEVFMQSQQWKRLEHIAMLHHVALFLSHMSVTLAVHVGADAIMLAVSSGGNHADL